MENLILVLWFIVLMYSMVRIMFKYTNEYKYLIIPSIIFIGSYWYLIEPISHDVCRIPLITISYITLIFVRILAVDDIHNSDIVIKV